MPYAEREFWFASSSVCLFLQIFSVLFLLLLVVLAHDFDLRSGRVEITVPDVITGSDFSVVCEYPNPIPSHTHYQF